MTVAALIVWIITALGGFVLLGTWLKHSGAQQGASRLPAGVVFGHFVLAVVGLVLWIVYLIVDAPALAWISFILIIVIALLGFTMFFKWTGSRRATTDGGTAVAESHFSVPVVVLHGLLAVATLVLVLIAAIEA